jgi:hypothetical protein
MSSRVCWVVSILSLVTLSPLAQAVPPQSGEYTAQSDGNAIRARHAASAGPQRDACAAQPGIDALATPAPAVDLNG